MKSDIEIAREAKKRPIGEIATKLGLGPNDFHTNEGIFQGGVPRCIDEHSSAETIAVRPRVSVVPDFPHSLGAVLQSSKCRLQLPVF